MEGIIVWIATHQLAAPFGWTAAQLISGWILAVVGMFVGVFVFGAIASSAGSDEGAGCFLGIVAGAILAPILFILGLWVIPLAAGITITYQVWKKLYYRRWQPL